MDKLVTLLSLAITPFTIIASITVVCLWSESAVKAYHHPDKEDMDWLILGVFISFIGASVDNFYWGIAWTADYINHPLRDTIFNKGSYSNLPFRQICTSIAAYCHVRAAIETHSAILRLLAIVSVIVTSFYLFSLWICS